MSIRTENWNGNEIRFIEVKGEWWAILKDICDALHLRTKDVSQRLDTDMLERVPVEMNFNYNHEDGSNDIVVKKTRSSSGTVRKTQWMLAVNENGIYEALYASRRLEARKFRRWSGEVMKKLRTRVGLKQYEVMEMTNPNVQECINDILDTLYVDPDTGILMESITVQGGDVDQIPFK